MTGREDLRCGFCSQVLLTIWGEVSVESFSSLDHDPNLYDCPDFAFSFMIAGKITGASAVASAASCTSSSPPVVSHQASLWGALWSLYCSPHCGGWTKPCLHKQRGWKEFGREWVTVGLDRGLVSMGDGRPESGRHGRGQLALSCVWTCPLRYWTRGRLQGVL